MMNIMTNTVIGMVSTLVSTGKVEASSAMINNAAVGVPSLASFSFSVYGTNANTRMPVKRDLFDHATVLHVYQWQHPITQARGLLVTDIWLMPETRFLGCTPTYIDTYENTKENWQVIDAMDAMERVAAS